MHHVPQTQQILACRQNIDRMNQMVSQMEQSERNNQYQLQQLAQAESNTAQQLQRLGQAEQQAVQQLSQLRQICSSLGQQLDQISGMTETSGFQPTMSMGSPGQTQMQTMQTMQPIQTMQTGNQFGMMPGSQPFTSSNSTANYGQYGFTPNSYTSSFSSAPNYSSTSNYASSMPMQSGFAQGSSGMNSYSPLLTQAHTPSYQRPTTYSSSPQGLASGFSNSAIQGVPHMPHQSLNTQNMLGQQNMTSSTMPAPNMSTPSFSSPAMQNNQFGFEMGAFNSFTEAGDTVMSAEHTNSNRDF